MPGKGEIIVTNRGHVNRDGRLFINLSVKDNGPGIPANLLEKLFQPVPSTKGGEDRGLGLSIVHDLINKMNGSITCQSSKSGTAFEIMIPVQSRSSASGYSSRA
jgi:nitrogen-specific signal transduction histidine kinase